MRVVRADGLALLGLAGFWIWQLWRVFADLDDLHYGDPGPHVDAAGQLWMAWWAERALGSPELDLFHCPLLNHPVGSEALSYDLAFSHALAAGALRPWLGPLGAINGVFAAVVLFDLVAIYLLLRQLTRGALLAAAGACSVVLLAVCHPPDFLDLEVCNLGWLALALASWLALLRHRRPWLLATTVLAIGLTCLSQMYYGLSLVGILVIGAWVPPAPDGRFPSARPPARLTLAVLAAGLVLAALPLLPSIVSALQVGLFPAAHPPDAPDTSHLEHTGLGWRALLAVPALAVVAALTRTRAAWVLLVCAALLLLAAIGPPLVVGSDRGSAVPAPWTWLSQHAPLLWRIHFPRRFGIVALLVGALLIAEAHRVWTGDGARSAPLRSLSAAILISVLLLVGCLAIRSAIAWPPTAPVPAGPPAASSGFDLACGRFADRVAYDQAVHGRPIAGTPLRPGDIEAGDEDASPATRHLRFYCDDPRVAIAPPTPEWLREQGIGHVVLRRDSLLDGDVERHRAVLGPPVFEDGEIVAFQVPGPEN